MAFNPSDTFKRASKACVIYFLALVKYVPNFTLFCRESELCCNFSILGVIFLAFHWEIFTFIFKIGTNKLNYIILAFIDMWQSSFAHTCYQIHITLFCQKITFVKIYSLFQVNFFWIQHYLCKKNCLFPCLL